MKRVRSLSLYLSISVFLIGITLIFILYLVLAVSKQGTSFFSNEEINTFEGSFQVSYAGEEAVAINTPFRFQGIQYHTATLTRTLQENDFPQNNFMLYAWTSYQRIMLDGEVLYELHADDAIPHMNPSSGWMMARLPADYAGKELTIEITPLVDGYESFPFEILSGTKAALIFYVGSKAAASLLLAFTVFIFGVFVLILSFFIKKTNLFPRAILLGLVSICAGIWIFSESASSQLFFDNRFLISTICSTTFFLLPVLSIALLMTYHDFREYLPLKMLFFSFSALFIVMLFCNSLGIVSWLRLVTFYHALIILTFITIGFQIYSKQKKHEEITDSVLIHGLSIFAVFIVIDIIAYLVDQGRSLFFSRIGLLVIYITLFINITQLIKKAYIEELYKKLAYEDLMTGCKNRTAFEEQKDNLERNHKDESLILFLSDMNNLKIINDEYGHAQGDVAIRNYADLLKEIFKGHEVYRIGGDEFCVIARNCSVEEFRKLTEKLNTELNSPAAKECLLSAAFSFNETTGAEIDRMFKRVDKEMYIVKKQMKKIPAVS